MEKTFTIFDYEGNCITLVAYASIIEHIDYIYCEYFEVHEEYRSKGYGRTIIDNILAAFPNKPLRYTLTSKDSLGAKFWNHYTEDKKVIHIKGLTYEIQRS